MKYRAHKPSTNVQRYLNKKYCQAFYGAESRTRTGTRLPSKDFKSFASTYFATSAHTKIFLYGKETAPVVEAAPGLEPGIKVLQTHALPLGYAAQKFHPMREY